MNCSVLLLTAVLAPTLKNIVLINERNVPISVKNIFTSKLLESQFVPFCIYEGSTLKIFSPTNPPQPDKPPLKIWIPFPEVLAKTLVRITFTEVTIFGNSKFHREKMYRKFQTH